MPLAAADANAQIAALSRLIRQRDADGKITKSDANAILAQAKKENVQGGELGLLRELATNKDVVKGERSALVKAVDQIVPAGAPTAQMAAIIFRLDPNTGRRQLLNLLDNAHNPVAGGPKTFVVRGLGAPYLATITTAQATDGLVKFLDGASPKDAHRIRHLLNQQLDTFEKPVDKGGLAVRGRVPGAHGLAFSDDTREGGIIAVNQQAQALRALEKVGELKGKDNEAIAARARGIANRAAKELHADLDYAYPANGTLSYSLAMVNGKPTTPQLEDGEHLLTTLQALKSLTHFKKQFQPVVDRIEKRLPEMKFAGPEDLTGDSGHIFTPQFEAFREQAHRILAKPKVTGADVAQLKSMAASDGLVTPGEAGLIREAEQRAKS
jgi:hypothetical protein